MAKITAYQRKNLEASLEQFDQSGKNTKPIMLPSGGMLTQPNNLSKSFLAQMRQVQRLVDAGIVRRDGSFGYIVPEKARAALDAGTF